MLVIFLGVIGGFMLSGFIGLFTGAVVMSIGYKLFTAWINTGPTGENPVESAKISCGRTIAKNGDAWDFFTHDQARSRV